MMRYASYVLVGIFACLMMAGPAASGEEKELIIFNKDRPISIAYSKCGTSTPKMGVKVDTSNGTINWKWENKGQAWCGWGTESLPENDFRKFLGGDLVVKFIGNYLGHAPEVKFIDRDDTHTQIVSLDDYIVGDPATGATATLPLSLFGFDPDFSADPSKVRTIQFDAEYNSIRGKIKIDYIGLISKGDN